MISPRRASPVTEPALLEGLLGAAEILLAVRAAVAGLAADGREAGEADRSGEGGAPGGEAASGGVVDVVLGLAALADEVARRLAEDGDPAEPGGGGGDGEGGEGEGDGCARNHRAVGELLR